MNDDSNMLKLLIQLGVLGQEDVAAAKKLLEETGEAGKDSLKGMNESMPENLAGWSKFKGHLFETGKESGNVAEGLHDIRKVMRMAGPEASELGHLLHFALNPAMLLGAGGAAALEGYFHALEKIEERYRALIELGAKVNDTMREIVNARPTELQEWMKFVEQVARLHENTSGIKSDLDLINDAARSKDQNTAKNAFEFQKNAADQAVIINEIARLGRDLDVANNRAGTRLGSVDAAQKNLNEAEANKADVVRQIELLPKAIADAAKSIDEARNFKVGIFTRQEDIDNNRNFLQSMVDLKDRLERQLDAAKSDFPGAVNAEKTAREAMTAAQENARLQHDLPQAIARLNSQLDVLRDAQSKETRHQQVQNVIDAGKGAGASLGEMGGAVHLTQQQIVTIAERILDHQMTIQQALAGLRARQAQMERQMGEHATTGIR